MSNKSKEVVIVNAFRTPIGTYKGSLKNIKSHDLGSIVIKEVLKRSKFDKDEIDEVVMGQVLTAGTGQNPARQAAINAGIPISKPAHIVNQVCGSGLRAVISGYQSIKLGEATNIISGGQENMSIAPHSIFYRDEKKISEDKLLDTMINDGLTDAFNNYHMGVTAENVAKKFDISRQDQDEFALISQKKTEAATLKNKFDDELIKINQDGNILDKDEHPRMGLELADLKKLKTVFKDNGTVTPGNSSGINDGAAALLLTTLEEAEKKSIKPLAKIVSWASVGGCAARGFERSRAITSVPRGPRQGTNTSLRGSARSSNCRWCRSQSYNRRDAARCRRPRLPRARKPCDGLASGPSEPCLACGQPTRHPGPPRFPVLQQACFCTGRRVAARLGL